MKNTTRRYSPEWLLNCMMLNIKSPATYNLLRSQNILPLPCKATIKKYLKNSNVGVGFDDDFFSLFQKQLDILRYDNPLAVFGNLVFDEIQVRKGLSVNLETMTFSGLMDFGSSPKENTAQEETISEVVHGEANSISDKERLLNLKNKQADHALVFMFSSIGGKFHQPVGIFTSKNTTPAAYLVQLILTAIISIEKCNGKVMGLVCDGAKTNRRIWKEFGIGKKLDGKTVCSFENPYDEAARQVYVISDVPHLIKCIRNNLYERRSFKINNEFIKWEYYEKIYEVDKNMPVTARMCPKLTPDHIKPTNMLKMRVFLATQIFSNSVANALEFLASNPTYAEYFDGCQPTITFTKRMNDMTDLLNISDSYIISSEPKYKHNKDNFFKEMNECINWLEDWQREIDQEIAENEKEKIKAIALEKKRQKDTYTGDFKTFLLDKKKIQIIKTEYTAKRIKIDRQFLSRSTAAGLRVTLHSTIELSNFLLNSCNFRFVLTRKFNQDCLERFFGSLRSAGRQNDHPTLPTLLQLYHLLSVYKIVKPPKFGNCENNDTMIEERPKLTLDDFKTAFDKKKSTSFRKDQLQKLEQKLEEYAEEGSWDLDETIEIDIEMDTDAFNSVIYYLIGFVCKNMQAKCKGCSDCLKAFKSEEIISLFPVAEFTNIKNRGKLVYPSKYMFETFLEIENIFKSKLDAGNVFDEVISEMFERKLYLKFPCKKHKAARLAECIHYYISIRLKQTARLINKNGSTTSNAKRKEAKLIS